MIAATVEDPVDGHIVNGASLNGSDLDDTTIEWFGQSHLINPPRSPLTSLQVQQRIAFELAV